MKTIKALLLLTLMGGLTSNIYAGGPWLQKKNAGFVQAQAIMPAYRYSSLLMGRFIKDVQGVNRKTFNSDYGIYLEYGITDNWNIITKVPFKYISTGELTDQAYFAEVLPAGDLVGMSNYEFDVKYKVVDRKVKVAVSLNTLWNTISQDLDKGLATGFDANAFGLTMHIGRSSAKHYGFLEVGYQKFTNNFSDRLEINIEHGCKLGNRFYLATALNATHSLKNGSYYNANLAQTGLYPNNQEWAAISAKLSYENETGWGVNMALPIVPIKFNYVGFNGTIAMGVFKKFNP